MTNRIRILCGLIAVAGGLNAAPIVPISYDMPNGDGQAEGGTWNYWDGLYTGSGSTTTDGAPLSGGLGVLTDGFIPTHNWAYYGLANDYPNGPYVGWLQGAPGGTDPTIDFHFAGTVDITSVTIYSDNSYGGGGVGVPGSAVVNGKNFTLTEPPYSGDDVTGTPTSFTLPVSVVGNELDLTLNQDLYPWLFISQVTFNGSVSSSVPDSGLTVAMLGMGISGLAFIRRKI